MSTGRTGSTNTLWRPRIQRMTQFFGGLLLLQVLALFLLFASFPSPPPKSILAWQTPLEILLIPLLPLARTPVSLNVVSSTHSTFQPNIFSRKWIYWPLTRARRRVLYSWRRWKGLDQIVRYINIQTTTSKLLHISHLPPYSTTSHTRFVVVSDTHLLHRDLNLPPGDVLLHGGDILVEDHGVEQQGRATGMTPRQKRLLDDFDEWIAEQKETRGFQKVLVAGGNHDGILQTNANTTHWNIRNGSFLHNQGTTVSSDSSNGDIVVYMSASSRGGASSRNHAFQYSSDKAAEEIWSHVPSQDSPSVLAPVDILLTHGTPRGVLDGPAGTSNAGCKILLQHVTQRIRPKLHIFGHWHASPGVHISPDHGVIFVNAASVDFDYAIANPPIVFDIAKPTN